MTSGFRTILHRPGLFVDVVVPSNQRSWVNQITRHQMLHSNFDTWVRQLSSAKNNGSYHSNKEIQRQVSEWESKYPELVHASVLGYGWGNLGASNHNPIHLVTVKKGQAEKPAVLLFGGIHSRELSSTEVLLRLTDRFLLSASTPIPEGGTLLDRVTLYIIPCLNPDGRDVVFNGNIWWRKNCRPSKNSNTITGVDLNRNFPCNFGDNHPYGGSSGATNSETYRGPFPFSEPESRALRDLVESQKDIVASVSLHSYGGFILVPNGFNGVWPSKDKQLFTEVLNSIDPEQIWPRGTVKEMLGYYSNGRHDDWLYHNTENKKESILALQLEVGNSFYPPAHELKPMTDSVGKLVKNLCLRVSEPPLVSARTVESDTLEKSIEISVKNRQLDCLKKVKGRVYIEGKYAGSFYCHTLGGMLRGRESSGFSRQFPVDRAFASQSVVRCQVTLRWGSKVKKYTLTSGCGEICVE